MKKLMLGAVAAAALMTPGMAGAETNAVVGFDYNSIDYGAVGDADSYGFDAAFSHGFSNGWDLQVDGSSLRVDAGGCCTNSGYAAMHLGMHNDRHSLAGFVGFQDFAIFSGLSLGVEGQMYLSQATIGGSVSHTDFGDIDLEATHVQVDGSYFINPDFSLSAGFAHTDADFGDWNSWGVGGEYRFAGSPASVSLGYKQADFDGAEVDALTIGLTLDLGTGSLHDRSRSGPSWNGARSLNDNLGGALGFVI